MVTLPTETPGCQLLLRRLVVGRDTFSPLAPVLGLPKNTGYVTLYRCEWRSVCHEICDIRVHMHAVFVTDKKFRSFTLNQLIAIDQHYFQVVSPEIACALLRLKGLKSDRFEARFSAM